jgi:Tol biopolymer transport system component
MAAIVKEEAPELGATNAKISPALDKIVRRCLEKKPEMRFQSASDLGFALEALSTSPGASGSNLSVSTVTKRPGWRERIAWIVAGLAMLAALGVAYFNRSSADTRAVRLAFVPPENLAFDNVGADYVRVSPDGQKLVFTGQSEDGKRQLWVRALDSMEASPLPGTDDPLVPFWSPDSRSIGFSSQGKLKRIDLAGGRPQTLCDAPDFNGGTWSRAGVIVFAPNSGGGLYQVPATGGEPKPVTSRDAAHGGTSHRHPYFLPDGRHFLYRVLGTGEHRTFAGSLDSKEVKQVLPDGASAVYAPPGWLLFVRNGALLAQAFDAENLELKGEAFSLTRPTNDAIVLGAPISVSDNGVLIWQGNRQRENQLIWFDRVGKQGGAIGPPSKVISGQAPRLAPDGKRVVIQRSDSQTRNLDIWVIDLARNLPTRLTSDPAYDMYPLWSPDGSRVVFQTTRAGVSGLYQKAGSGMGTEELLLKGGGFPTAWSADGRFILSFRTVEKTRWDVWALPLTGERQPYPLLNSEFDEYRAQLSADGHWLAYVSDESGSYEVYMQPFTADGKLGGAKQRISTSGGNHPRFRRDGRELFYVAADGQMMAVALKPSGATFEFEPPKALFKTRMLTGLIQSGIEYDVTADGQRFLIGTQVGEPSPVSVILNWTAGVKK